MLPGMVPKPAEDSLDVLRVQAPVNSDAKLLHFASRRRERNLLGTEQYEHHETENRRGKLSPDRLLHTLAPV